MWTHRGRPRSLFAPIASGRRGTTLVEVSIASGLLGLVVLCMYWVMAEGSRYVRVTNATIEIQEQALASLARLTDELAETNVNCLKVQDDVGILFGSPRDADGRLQFDAAGRPLWMKLIAYYRDQIDGVDVFVRKEKMLVTATPDPPDFVDTVPSVATDRSLPARVIARHTRQFTATLSNPVDITLEARLVDGERIYQINLATRSVLRN